MIQKKMTEEGLHYWQKKFNVADERIKELERQVNASRRMRDMLEGVKEEKIALIRSNMEDLKGTYEKFMHENTMCAEDVRSEGIRNKEKYEKGQEVIAHLQAVIEMHVKTAQADKLKGQRERETLEMNLQDYETHLRKIQGENTQIREKLRQTGEDLQVEKNEIFRYQKEYEETPFISHAT